MTAQCEQLLVYLLITFGTLGNFAIHAAPLDARDAEEVAGLFEGDMLLTPAQKIALTKPLQARNGLVSETKRWPNRVVLYKIVGDFTKAQHAAILNGIRTIESFTCLRFQDVSGEPTLPNHYLAITSQPGGCFTAVGYLAKVQQMNLQPYPLDEGCFRAGTILHEFMHAIGFYHEQSAADRDKYIRVLYENVVPGKEFNFVQYNSDFVTNFDVGYDYLSCLHYRANAFSVNGQDTIVPLDPQAKIGQRLGLSRKDIDKINVMYKCPIDI